VKVDQLGSCELIRISLVNKSHVGEVDTEVRESRWLDLVKGFAEVGKVVVAGEKGIELLKD